MHNPEPPSRLHADPAGAPALQPLDYTSLRAVLAELRPVLLPSRFEKAQQSDPSTLQLGLRSLAGSFWLELSWLAEAPRLLAIPPPPRLGEGSTLAQQLQHGLRGLALVELHQPAWERLVELRFAARPGEPVERTLLLELMGRHSNLFLLDAERRVIALARQVRDRQSRLRPIGTGDPYQPPPPQAGEPPRPGEAFETWRQRLSLLPLPLGKALLGAYQGTSPALVRQLLELPGAGLPLAGLTMQPPATQQPVSQQPVSELTEQQWHGLWQRWRSWLGALEQQRFALHWDQRGTYRCWSLPAASEIEAAATAWLAGEALGGSQPAGPQPAGALQPARAAAAGSVVPVAAAEGSGGTTVATPAATLRAAVPGRTEPPGAGAGGLRAGDAASTASTGDRQGAGDAAVLAVRPAGRCEAGGATVAAAGQPGRSAGRAEGAAPAGTGDLAINRALAAHYGQLLAARQWRQRRQALEARLRAAIERERQQLAQQRDLLAAVPAAEGLQQQADALLCRPDPDRDTIEQAQSLYRRARKLRRSAAAITPRIELHQQRLAGLETSLTFLEQLDGERSGRQRQDAGTALAALEEELLEQLERLRPRLAMPQTGGRRRSRRRQAGQAEPCPLELRSAAGLRLQVGRNHRQNEWISLRQARRGDLWFHAQELPGSHVVLKGSEAPPGEADLQAAADLAAHFSRGRGNRRVPVLMVAAETLQRIPGAEPGTVRHRGGELLWGEPERALALLQRPDQEPEAREEPSAVAMGPSRAP